MSKRPVFLILEDYHESLRDLSISLYYKKRKGLSENIMLSADFCSVDNKDDMLFFVELTENDRGITTDSIVKIVSLEEACNIVETRLRFVEELIAEEFASSGWPERTGNGYYKDVKCKHPNYTQEYRDYIKSMGLYISPGIVEGLHKPSETKGDRP